MLEVYGAASCQYTAQLLEELEWQGEQFTYIDVEQDAAAFSRLVKLTGQRAIPVLLEDGKVKTLGYLGRSCSL